MSGRQNPFFFRALSADDPFCDRVKEIEDLVGYARAQAAVVLFSPRRYGKTSLMRRVQQRLARDGCVVAFADFFGVTSLDDLAKRLAHAVYAVIRQNEPLIRKAARIITSFRPVFTLGPEGTELSVEPTTRARTGPDLLRETMASLQTFVTEAGADVALILDEFQELTELDDHLAIEGIMREHIQQTKAAFFFVGSRRRVLLDMFNTRARPFYQSAINYPLAPLPQEEFAAFIREMFTTGGKACPADLVDDIVAAAAGHPYYVQKLCFLIFEACTADAVTADCVHQGLADLVTAETPVFEAILQGLALKQIALLKALALEEGHPVFSATFMVRHGLGSTGAVQAALRKLASLDLIEQTDRRSWRLVDPMLRQWLRRMP